VPVASDYSRHSRTPRDAFVGSFLGYSITQIACYALGLVALFTVAKFDNSRIFTSFMAVPLGTLAFAVIAIRELDQSFVDTYSTAVSLQNFRVTWDRRVLALVVGTLATVGALALNVNDYENFLILIGSVFTPLLGVLVVDWFVLSRGAWDLSERARLRRAPIGAWVLGFVAYQLVNPGYISWWARMWGHVDDWLHFTPPSWLSASILSFLVAAVAMLVVGTGARRRNEELVC
jgi:purine-cytosine permease-like protein